MTDKQFIETLKNIKEYCEEKQCYRCKFYSPLYVEYCEVQRFTKELSTIPVNWDIEKIERILKDYD